MTKQELIELLKSEMPDAKEGAVPPNLKPPYLAFWEIDWDYLTASDEVNTDVVTYQISFFSDKPRHPKLMSLLLKFRELSIRPNVKHEYVDDLKCVHSAFTIEVLEDLFDGIET